MAYEFRFLHPIVSCRIVPTVGVWPEIDIKSKVEISVTFKGGTWNRVLLHRAADRPKAVVRRSLAVCHAVRGKRTLRVQARLWAESPVHAQFMRCRRRTPQTPSLAIHAVLAVVDEKPDRQPLIEKMRQPSRPVPPRKLILPAKTPDSPGQWMPVAVSEHGKRL